VRAADVVVQVLAEAGIKRGYGILSQTLNYVS
jgi:hypothetical protein